MGVTCVPCGDLFLMWGEEWRKPGGIHWRQSCFDSLVKCFTARQGGGREVALKWPLIAKVGTISLKDVFMNTADNTAMNQCLSRPIFYRGQLHQVTQEPCLVDCSLGGQCCRSSEAAGKRSVESLLNVVVNLLKVRQMTPVSRRAAKKLCVETL